MDIFKDTTSVGMPIEDLITLAQQSKLLRDSPAFQWAISEVYKDLVAREDQVSMTDTMDPREQNDLRRNLSQARVSLLSLVRKLDELIHVHEQKVGNK